MNQQLYATYSDLTKPIEERYAAAMALSEEAADPKVSFHWKMAATALQSQTVDHNGYPPGSAATEPPMESRFDLSEMEFPEDGIKLLNEGLRQSNLFPSDSNDPDVIPAGSVTHDRYSGTVIDRQRTVAESEGSPHAQGQGSVYQQIAKAESEKRWGDALRLKHQLLDQSPQPPTPEPPAAA